MYQPPLSPTLYNPYTSPQYNAGTSPSVLSYYPPFSHTSHLRSSPVPEISPLPPDLTTITPAVASRAIHRLITSELRDAGFDSAQLAVVKRIEVEVVAFVEQLFYRAHEYANLSNRAGAIATDLVLACDEFNMSAQALRSVKTKNRQKQISDMRAPTLLPAPSRSPSPELLPSDDEGAGIVIPLTLRTLPSYPSLPPKHTYQMTPASPPKKAALPSLEKKLKTAGLVQESLKNLMLATEDSANQEDGELLGHIVNWEVGMHPRKRWKTSR